MNAAKAPSVKRFLLISKSPPYGSSSAKDLLDVALTCSVFEQPVSLLLLGDAVLQLLPKQHSAPLGQKNLNALQDSLAMYDIESIYVDEKALTFHGLSCDDLQINASALNRIQIQNIISEHDVVINF